MRFTKLFIIASAIYILDASLSTKFALKFQTVDLNLAKSICKITNDVISKSTDTQDILFLNSKAIKESTTVNKVLTCIYDETAVVVTEFRKKTLIKGLRKAAVIIMAFDSIDGISIAKFIVEQRNSTVFHHMAKVIFIAPNSSTQIQRLQALEYFLGLGFLNVAIAHEASSVDVYYEIVQSLSRHVRTLVNPLAVFPDKLRNAEGFRYKLPIYYQPGVLTINKNNKISSPMLYFLQAIKDVQNAEFDITFLLNVSHFDKFWKN
ncbi:unnamed protein product [Chironomus riparius]|uniref:Receptor ligand binding region domain-containing protein n=1 Tax=Chironomus riparius TaxID=315576 RepID=A0A9N9SAJ6_9DIPT|nr:unnamed protein product [Chironomus riparius]